MMPRLPVNIPRYGVAMMSPDGVTRFCRGILLLLLPACGEKVGMRGTVRALELAESPPHPDFSLRVKSDLSPQAGRGEGTDHAAPSRIGGWNDSAVSQGKKIQVSCDTSVMKVSTNGRPIGFAYTVAKCASGIMSRTSRPVLPVSTRSSTINSPLPVPPPSFAVSAEMPLRTFKSPCLV